MISTLNSDTANLAARNWKSETTMAPLNIPLNVNVRVVEVSNIVLPHLHINKLPRLKKFSMLLTRVSQVLTRRQSGNFDQQVAHDLYLVIANAKCTKVLVSHI